MQPGMQSEPAYALGHSKTEIDRLIAQAMMYEPFTRQFLQEAGLAPGMRVLDVGSGAGDVAFLAASVVGPDGEVLGVDRSEPAVALSRARSLAKGLRNVSFRTGDPVELVFERAFDAVIGRLVLMFYPDPVLALKKLARLLLPGGIIAFQDFDMFGARSFPSAPLFDQCLSWILQAFRHAGADLQMGLRMHSAFISAGLPPPQMRLDAVVGAGQGHLAYFVVAEVVRSLLPVMEKHGIATAAEVQVDTLHDRLEAEIAGGGHVILSPSLIGAWARVGG